MIRLLLTWDQKLPEFLKDHSCFKVVREISDSSPYLYFHQEKLALMTSLAKKEGFKPFFLDFINIFESLEKKGASYFGSPLVKALGLKKNQSSLIWDISCGMGRDALLFLYFNAHVVAFERNRFMWALLKDAWLRACKHPRLGPHFHNRFKLVGGDPRDYSSEKRPDMIYFDPMYLDKTRKSLPGKEMRIIREVVGDDQDSEEVLEWAKKVARFRLVLKRARLSTNLGAAADHMYVGRSTRFDTYFLND
jgi:16S rRNA (guanine1516-N2)-methyltransferase